MSEKYPPLVIPDTFAETGKEVREWACHLVDAGICSPPCLMATDPTCGAACDCVCDGLHHGSLRHPFPSVLAGGHG